MWSVRKQKGIVRGTLGDYCRHSTLGAVVWEHSGAAMCKQVIIKSIMQRNSLQIPLRSSRASSWDRRATTPQAAGNDGDLSPPHWSATWGCAKGQAERTESKLLPEKVTRRSRVLNAAPGAVSKGGQATKTASQSTRRHNNKTEQT